MTAELLNASLQLSLPELTLALGALALLMIGVFIGERATGIVTWLAIALLAVAGLLLFTTGDGVAYNGAFVSDAFGRFMKGLVLIASIIALFLGAGQSKLYGIDRFEYPVLIVLATLGMLLMASANNMMSLYMALELQSLAAYVVAAMNRDDVKSTEAGLKYFVLGALSSGMLLYGMSLVYGFTGHTGFTEIAAALQEGRSLGLVFGLVFVLAGVAFKISAVPFHMWTPDVYEGAPTPVTTFFAGAPKIAAIAMLIRVVITAFEPVTADWQQIIVFISIASMVLGSFAAIGQRNLKRLMAYSSIGHMGYALVGLSAGSVAGVRGVVLYMLIYMVMTLGTFACILAMRRKDGKVVEEVQDLAGLSQTNPFMAVVLTALMFSLAGIPPLAGFFAKYFVFLAAIEAKLYALAIIGVLASVVGAYYYLRVVKLMWFDEPQGEFARPATPLKLVYGLSGLFLVAYVLIGGPIGSAADVAARTFF
ncbi:NADH-quinone oxidoreductase subunit NuoN [Rhizobium sp. CC-YZS058]|uniref:NADH-quinone oxidoreductase subunit NuoN n=1 Tax=Rhizobium sp. CC-YZS058 TaxID=3042153 RepID=UPI002B0594E8|nr:NADH-quinone oxidoreductase subunit NuoN [Rhizobium sp. CC-YZS058]MEA3535230.1 NADH-quinone oxidoreductase subunit NuoN [Rhizobium sp. CC-YZS058]